MIKKTKLRKLKGGKTFLEKTFGFVPEGPIVAENLYENVVKKKDIDLKEEYKLRKELADTEYEIAEKKYKKDSDLIELREDRNFKYNKLHRDDFFRYFVLFFKAIKSFLGGVLYYGSIILEIFTKRLSEIYAMLGNGAYKLSKTIREWTANLGRGAVTKFIILLFILGIFIGIFFAIFGVKSSSPLADVSKNVKLDVITQMKPTTFLTDMSNTINNLIPEQYKIQFTAFRNNINKAMGNDIVATSIYNQPRETIDHGRYNDITNININETDKIYSIYKPRTKNWNIELDNYKDSDIDFYKLPENIQKEILNLKENKNHYSSNNNSLNYQFIVQESLIDATKKGRYRYILNSSNIPITTDTNLINIFPINPIKINGINITDKDITKDKTGLMFSYSNNSFIYPNIQDKINIYNSKDR